MDFYQLPLGFGMALSANFEAMNAYSAMTDGEKEQIVERARNARSEAEMHQIVSDILKNRMH